MIRAPKNEKDYLNIQLDYSAVSDTSMKTLA